MSWYLKTVDLIRNSSVADPWFLSRIPDPDFYSSRIPDLGSRIPDLGSRISYPGSKNSNKRQSEKKLVVIPFNWSHKFHKIKLFYFWNVEEEKNWANFQRIIELFTENIATKLSKIWVGIPDPGVKKTPDPGSGSATLPAKGTVSLTSYNHFFTSVLRTFLFYYRHETNRTRNLILQK